MIRTRIALAIVLLFAAALGALPAQSQEWNVRFGMCGRDPQTCVVDGDTIWLQGVNLRLEGYDTPEPYTDICGGQAEVALAKRASARLLHLLNGNPFTVETHGTDRYDRTLATIRIGGTDVGDILISEGLARKWPNGREFWC
ncbi:MAG TPA: thermonuclease family protein [Devosiaceae bacterium]|jgi:endonuclease YncB( thermonuclease family)|nr:thermonuclease family protein [Devosiaceae bacterium]